MNIYIPNTYRDQLTNNQILDILRRLNINETNYNVILERRFGRNIKIEHNNRLIYVIFSRQSAEDGRNTFLTQYLATVLSFYVNDETEYNKEIYVYLLDTSRRALASYIVDTYRMLKNLSISILNEDQLDFPTIERYQTLREWKSARENRKNYNSGNNSTYVLDGEEECYIYGKSFGANGKETAFISCVVAQIATHENKETHLYQVEDNNATQISENDRNLLEYYGVIVEGNLLPAFGPNQNQIVQPRQTSRNQAVFQFNLLNKYGDKKCVICGSDIEESIIASHIHRVADIDNSNDDWNVKCEKAVDPDNGFWLCANHDKWFEYGLIYFRNQNLIISNQLNQFVESIERNLILTLNSINDQTLKNQLKAFISKGNDLLVLRNYQIEDAYFSPRMRDYLELHKTRVNGI